MPIINHRARLSEEGGYPAEVSVVFWTSLRAPVKQQEGTASMVLSHKSISAIAFVILSLAFILSAPAFAAGGFNVVKIIDLKGELRYEVVESDILPYLKKEIDTEYKAAKKEWSKAREEWKRVNGKKLPFDRPEPVKPLFKVMAKKLKDKSEAANQLQKFEGKGTYVIVQVVRGNSKGAPEVILKDEIGLKKYELGMEHFEKVQKWLSEKNAFEKENPGTAYERNAPVKPSLKILKNGLKTMDKATALLEKYSR
jgi:hypothetical protein